MLRRFFIFLCVFSILFSFLVFSVSAASSDNFTLHLDNHNSNNPFSSTSDLFPSSGSYYVSYTGSIPGMGNLNGSFIGTFVSINSDGLTMVYLPFSALGENLVLAYIDFDTYILVQLQLNGGGSINLPVLSEFDFTFEKIHQDSFEVSTSNGLNTSINWVNTVVNSIINNGLWQLAAIPIAIALLLCAAKVIRFNSWGL